MWYTISFFNNKLKCPEIGKYRFQIQDFPVKQSYVRVYDSHLPLIELAFVRADGSILMLEQDNYKEYSTILKQYHKSCFNGKKFSLPNINVLSELGSKVLNDIFLKCGSYIFCLIEAGDPNESPTLSLPVSNLKRGTEIKFERNYKIHTD